MAQQRLLFVDAHRLSAYHWDAGKLRLESEFTAEEPGLAAFAAYLAQRRQSLFTILADVAEEGFQAESVPFVQGADRGAMIKRKLGQYYYGTPLAAAISQGREKTGRRDERLLFVALTRPQQFDPWLAALREAEAQVAGLHTLPLIASGFAAEAAAVQARLLLVTLSRSGLRQTFFENGHLRFSRLTPAANADVRERAALVAAESAKIYHYLAGQRLIGRADPLPTLVLLHPADLPTFREYCQESDELRFAYLDLPAVAKEHGLKTAVTDSNSELLFLNLLAKKPPRQHLLPAAEQRFYRLWQFRVGLNSAAAVVFLGCLLFATREAHEYTTVTENTAALKAQAEADRQRHAAIMLTLPPSALPNESIRALIDRFQTLEARSPSIEDTYLAISRALEDAPRVELSRINWAVTTSPDEALQSDGRPGAGALRPTSAATPGGMFAVADIEAVLPLALANDQRAILETIDTFADHLRKEQNLQVQILRLPFDIESGKTLKSDSEVAVTAPRFSLRVVKRL